MPTSHPPQRLWRTALLVVMALVGLTLMGWAIKAQTTEAAGGLTVTILAAPNLVVDSNVLAPSTYAPSVATVAGKFCNTSGSAITNFTAYIGDYTGTGAEQGTPGLYPVRDSTQAAFTTQHPHLANTGNYQFIHVGGSTGLNDARRYIGTLAAGQCVYQYWHFTYPRRKNPNNTGNQPVWGATNDPNDDLWLNFDVWGVGSNGAASDNKTFKATMRNEISAMANKIVPNPNGVWFSTNTALVQPGGVITSNGILYTFGVVNQGFDNDGNFTPDFNAWAQPIGDPGFDPSCFRLIRTSGLLTVTRSGGNPDMVINFVDQLYFQDLPHDNTGVTGLVHYVFMALAGPCSTALSPYQEAASGSENEKFNGDYGIGVPPPVAKAPVITFDKSGPITAPAGGRITYTMALANPLTSTDPFGLSTGNMPPVISDTIPAGTFYVAGTASGSTNPATTVVVRYSTDGGTVFTTTEPTPPGSVTNLQWWMGGELPPGGAMTTTFVVTTPSVFVGTPVITNTACVQLDGGRSVACDDVRTILTGTNTIGNFVWRDENVDTVQGPITTEAGIAGVVLSLYYDINGNGALDGSDIFLITQTTNAGGFYTFTSVPNGNFLVVVDNNSPNIPFGYNATTSIVWPVTGLTGTATYLDADFGFGPVLILDKVLLQNDPAWEGENITYTIRLTNTRPGNGLASGGTCTNTRIMWSRGAFATTANSWTNPTNVFAKDDVFGQGNFGGGDDTLSSQPITPALTTGTITKVEVVYWVYKTGVVITGGNPDNFFVRIENVPAYTGFMEQQMPNGSFDSYDTSTNQGIFAYDVTTRTAWTWASFTALAPGLRVHKNGSADGGTLFMDATGWRVTYNYPCTPTPTDTLNPVPMTDTYDATRMQFVSATPFQNSQTTGGSTPYTNTGLISWSNLGPIYPGGSAVVTVSYKVLEPHNNATGTLTNTASVFNAKYADGRPANQVTDVVTSTAGPASTIGDFIWRDLDGDGVQDGGAEVGIPGVVVSLTASTAITVNGVIIPPGTTITTVTDANGFYSFSGLRTSGATNLTVAVATNTLPAGAFTNTGDPDKGAGACTVATCNSISTFSFNSATTNNDLIRDFGYTLPTLIAGTVWNDMNRNGASAPNTGEPYLGGVVVELRTTAGVLISTTTTDANGYYEFSGPFSGNYNVVVSTTTGTLSSGGWTQSYDEDGTGTAHTVAVVGVAAGGSSASNDFSYYLDDNASIGDTVYNDLNNTGVQDTGEPGLAGVRVWLYYDTNGDGLINPLTDALMMTATTNASGNYSFTDLGATSGSARYLVLVDTSSLPGTDYGQTGDPDETGVCTTCNDADTGISLTASQTYTTADFGYRRTGAGSIGDTIFRDTNGDGFQNLGETGLPSITVRLYISGVNVLTATSSLTGYYNFPGLPSGTYTVAVDANDPDIPNDSYGNRYIPTTTNPLTVILGTGQQYTDADFGFGPPGAIGDTVYWDFDQDGEQDYSDLGIPGVTVVLTNNTTVTVNGVAYPPGTYGLTTTTNASGTYLFTGLNPATYTVRVVMAGPLATGVQTGDPDRTSACTTTSTTYCDNELTFPKWIKPGTIFMGADFGYRNTSVIGNFVFNDLDGDGFQDPGEPGLPGVVISLTNGLGTVLMTTTTDIGGFYVFPTGALTPSTTYNIVFGTPANMVPVTNTTAALTGTGSVGNTISVSLSPTNSVSAIGGTPCTDCGLFVDAGFRLNGTLSIGGTIFFDNGLTGAGPNGGTYSAGNDAPLSQTTVYLWRGSTLVAVTTTAAGGTYTFTNLPSGVYTISTDIQYNTPFTFTYEPGWPTPGLVCNSTCNNWQPVTLTVSNVANQDFGVYANMDCGDLPASYGVTLLADGGACSLAQGPRLGTLRDAEGNGQPNGTATGDDAAGSDDEDGVNFGNYTAWTPSSSQTIIVTTTIGGGESAFIAAWFDWNSDGDFNDTGELTLLQNVVNGGNSINISVPSNYNLDTAAINTRFRIYSGTVGTPLEIVGAEGFANGGEVEDYQLPFGSATIGNYVWVDEDSDGVQDAGESGIPNAQVTLTGVDSLGRNVSLTTYTDADGHYVFSRLLPGNYTVTVVAASLPAGLAANPTYDENGTGTPHTTSFTLTTGEEHLTADFGYNWASNTEVTNPGAGSTGAIGNRLWIDADGDGVQDLGELGLNNVSVQLLTAGPDGLLGTADDVVAATTTTDGAGYYIFDGLTAGAYAVRVNGGTPPTGYTQTGDPDQSGAACTTCDNRTTTPIILGPGDVYLNADFGYQPSAGTFGLIGDTVWVDANRNNTVDAGEQRLPGVTVALIRDTNGNGVWDAGEPIVAATVTDNNGLYEFNGVPAADGVGTDDYLVWVNDTDNVLGTLAQTYDSDGTGTANISAVANLSPAGNLNQDFAYAPPGHDAGESLLGDTIFYDRNGNGTFDPGEGLEGVRVYLYQDTLFNGVFDGSDQTVAYAVTNENGQYFFGNLPAGNYVVSVDTTTLPAGLTNTVDPNGGLLNQSGLTLAANTANLLQDFGYRDTSSPNTIGGTLWQDTDANGTLAVTETLRLANVTVILYDTNGNIVGTTTTDASGTYTFTNLPDGTFRIDVVDNANGVDGYWHSTGATPGADNNSQSDSYTVTVSGGQTNTTGDFGYYRNPAALGNFVWLDFDEDGVQDLGEPGVPGVVVTLTVTWPNSGGTTTIATVTDANGFYSFGNLLIDENQDGAGSGEPTFSVRMGIPMGYSPSPIHVGSTALDSGNPNGESVAPVVEGTANIDADFGLIPASNSVGDFVWLDEDSDGVQDAGEMGIANVRVTLVGTDVFGNPVSLSTVTDSEGHYIFPHVWAGTYAVTVDTTSMPAGLAANPTYDENGVGTPHTTSITLTGSSQEYVTADFGYNWAPTTDVTGGTGTGTIGDRLWIDADGDGRQDPGEAGLAGVSVALITPGPDGLFGTADDVTAATTTTNSAGNYIFDNLAAGVYQVVVNGGANPAGYTPTGDPDQPNAVCTTCDNRTTTPIVLAPGDVYLNADFGYQPTGGVNALGNQIFIDANANGSYAAGEPGIPGMSVALIRDTNADGVWDLDGADNTFGTADDELIIATTQTDAAGQYNFPGLPNGSYIVWANDTSTVLAALYPQDSTPNNVADNGQACGACNRQNAITLSGTSNTFQDFGFAPTGHASGEGMIGDQIFYDYDADGAYDFGEGMEGVRVRLYQDTNSDGNFDAGEPLLFTTLTNENGQYFFGNLPAGNYVVQVDTTTLPAGVTNTVDVGDPTLNEGGVTLPAGGTNLNQDFGYRDTSSPNTIGGTLWQDTDADGVLDAGEAGRFANVTVVLYNSAGNIVGTTTTDASGNYNFTNLPDGTYRVDVADSNNSLDGYWHATGPVPGADNNSQSDPYTVTVTGGQTNTTGDFGYYRSPSQVGNFVWLDVDNDGVQDANEPGLPGVTVSLVITYPNGSVVTFYTVTNASGAYSFGNLLLDENHDGVGGGEPIYTIMVNPPVGTVPSPEALPSDTDQTDGDSDGTGETATLTEGETDPSYDFGFYASRLDLGDAPNAYNTLFATGPAHVIFPDGGDGQPDTTGGIPAVWLGNVVDAETDGQPNANATGDDLNSDDEDGLVFMGNNWFPGGSSNISITLNSSAATTAYYGVWIDWNNDGDFTDPGDAFYSGNSALTGPSAIALPIAIPGTYTSGSVVFFRLRVDDQAVTNTGFTGTLVNGEVEDYSVIFAPTAVTLTSFEAASNNNWLLILLGVALVLGVLLLLIVRRQTRRSAQ